MKRVKFEIDPDDKKTGVKAISLVDGPAMESDFIALSDSPHQYIELKIEGYKQVVAGLALLPDKDFLRVAPNGEKYVAYFTKESIEAIRNKFHKELMTANVNVDHSREPINAYLIESFIIDSQERLADVTAKGIKNPVMGSWFVAYKIEDEAVFLKVLSGELNGFSVEIFVQSILKKEGLEDSALAAEVKKLRELVTELINQRKGDNTLKSKGIYERRLKMINSQIANN